jgi:hypothetical protein
MQQTAFYKSEKVSLPSLQYPSWKETFTLPIETGKEVFAFEVFRHNSSEKDLLIDGFIVKMAEHTVTLQN